MERNTGNESFRKKFEAHLDSPTSILSKLKSLLFGDHNPDMYTQVSFFIGLFIASIFLIWSILGYVVIDGREWIQAEKGLNVQNLIAVRGVELGFQSDQFLGKLETFYFFSILVWISICVGLIMQWRKKIIFIYVIGVAAALYLLDMLFILGFEYWLEDTTLFDKILFFLLVGHSFLYAYFLKKELTGEKVDFFGLNNDDD